MDYFGLPERTARKVAAVGAVVCGALALSGTIDRTAAQSLAVQRLLLALGVAAGTLLGWTIEQVTHQPVTRRALWPWGALGGAAVLIVAAAQGSYALASAPLVGVSILRAVLAVAALRFTMDAITGPLRDIPPWAAEASDMPVWDNAKQWVPTQPLSLRPEDRVSITQPAPNQPRASIPDLRLISDEEEKNPDAQVDRPAQRRRTLP
jgi:hypothetical protein